MFYDSRTYEEQEKIHIIQYKVLTVIEVALVYLELLSIQGMG